VGGLIANATIPSHDQLQSLAEGLVPPGSVLTRASVVSGFEPLVGPPEAIAHFDTSGADVATVVDSVREHASQLGWTHVRTDDYPAGEILYWSRTEAKAAVHVRDFESTDDGVIFINHHASPMARLFTGLLLGASAGLLTALALHVVSRSRRPAEPPKEKNGA
jgi:hypothetical protein